MRECLLVLLVFSLFGVISCQNNPSSAEPDEPERYVLRGEVYNNFPDTPGPIWHASVQLISASDTISTQTDDRGQFEIDASPTFGSGNYELILHSTFFEKSEESFTVPDSSYTTGLYDVGRIAMELNNEGLYVAGEIERSVEDDSVVVHSSSSIGCYYGYDPANDYDMPLQNIGLATNFSLAVSKSCEEINIYIKSSKHRNTRYYSLNLKNLQIKESPARIDGLKYKIFEDAEPERVFVQMHFYTMINGEKRTPVWQPRGEFNVSKSGASAENIKPDREGTLEFDAYISPGRDTASVVLWGSQVHSFPRTNFALLDYKESGSDIIDLGEHEVNLNGVYVFGNLYDPYFEIEGDIVLKINGPTYPADNEGNFAFPTQKSQDSHTLVVTGDNYLQTDTTINLSQLQTDGDIYTGLTVPLKTTLYELRIQVDFIGVEGGILPAKSIPIDLVRLVEGSYSTTGNGVLTTRVNTKTSTNRKADKLWIEVNSFDNSSRLEDYTTQDFTFELDQYQNHKINTSVSVYKLRPPRDYTPEIKVGTKWEFNYLEGRYPATVEGISDIGTLYWEITEQLSDTTYVLKETFEGIHIYHYVMGDWETESNLTDSEYLLKVTNGRIRFEPITEVTFNSVEFIKSFDYELNLMQPSTYLGEYSSKTTVDGDYFTEKEFTFTYSEESGIKFYDYILNEDPRIQIEATLKSFTP